LSGVDRELCLKAACAFVHADSNRAAQESEMRVVFTNDARYDIRTSLRSYSSSTLTIGIEGSVCVCTKQQGHFTLCVRAVSTFGSERFGPMAAA
jgi:hypothetical protein